MAMRTAQLIDVVGDPRAAAHHPQRAAARTTRIAILAVAIGISPIPIGHPLPDVAGHVVELQLVGWIAADRPRAAMPLERRVGQKVGARRIDSVTPRVARAAAPAARGALPFGLGGQAHEAADTPTQPAAIRGGIGMGNQRDGMARPFAGHLAAPPHVRRCQFAKRWLLRGRDDQWQVANSRHAITGFFGELAVLLDRDRVNGCVKRIHMNGMGRAFVVSALIGAHDKLA